MTRLRAWREGRVRGDEIIDTMSASAMNVIIGVLPEASDLSRRLGPAIHSLFHTRRAREARTG